MKLNYKTIIAIYGQDAFRKHYEATKSSWTRVDDGKGHWTWNFADEKNLANTSSPITVKGYLALYQSSLDFYLNGGDRNLAVDKENHWFYNKKFDIILIVVGNVKYDKDIIEKAIKYIISELDKNPQANSDITVYNMMKL